MRKLLLVLSMLLIPCSAIAATFDPSFKFRVIETSHFSIYYHDGLEEISKRAASVSEEVYGKLTTLLQWEPQEKTHIVIADNADFANGMTTVTPYNAIYLQTAPPSPSTTIGEYDNWLRILIVHEYAHVLTSDPVRGYSRVTRKIFGKVVPFGDILSLLTFVATGPPNMMMPRWWHEGMSTWAETELTSSGRGRNSYYQMIYRTAVAEKNLPGIDRINGEIPYWPEGNSPYIFGSGFIQYIAEKYGRTLPGSISRQQSGRFPYFINGTVEDQLGGVGYGTIYGEMIAQMTSEQNRRIETLKSEPFTETKRIGKRSVQETNPRYSPDGSMLAFNRNDRHSHPVVVIRKADGTEVAKVRRLAGDGVITWTPDNESIFFCQGDPSIEGNLYLDLYRYDLKKKKLRRLTSGLRCAGPDISPDGGSLAVVINSRGNQNIGLLDLKTLKKQDSPKLLTGFKESRIASPRWSPDGKSIAYVLTGPDGNSSLNLLSVETSASRVLFETRAPMESLTWSADGKEIFYSSAKSGVFNIHRYSTESAANVQVTHLLSGAFSPDISPSDQTLAIDEYTSYGSTLSLVAKEKFRNADATAPSIKGGLYPVNSSMAETPTAATESRPVKSAPYSALPTLLPKFWLPSVIAESSTNIAIGAMTAGQDLLAYHTFLGSAYYGTGFQRGYFDALYKYGRFVPEFTLRGYALPNNYSNLLRSGDFTEAESGLLAAVSMPLETIESRLSINAGYHLRKQKPLTEGYLVAFNRSELFQGRRDSYFASLDYKGALKYPWSITSEEGRNLSLKFEYFGKASGSEIETREYTASWEEQIPVYKHQNILLRMNGGFSDGEQAAQQSFQLGGTTTFFNPYGLRGYLSRFASGDRIATGSAEYRFPIEYILYGAGTKPVFLDRLHGAVFVDAGEVWDKNRSFKGRDIMTGAGLEVRLDLVLGYWLKVTPAIGYAHGFDRTFGTDQIYFNIYSNL